MFNSLNYNTHALGLNALPFTYQPIPIHIDFKNVFLEFFDLLEQFLWCDKSFFLLEHYGFEKAVNCELIKRCKEFIELMRGEFCILSNTKSKHLIKCQVTFFNLDQFLM